MTLKSDSPQPELQFMMLNEFKEKETQKMMYNEILDTSMAARSLQFSKSDYSLRPNSS